MKNSLKNYIKVFLIIIAGIFLIPFNVKAGELCIAKVDVAAVQDGTGPLMVQEFKKEQSLFKWNLVELEEQSR